jgi:hypothetical protein
MSIEMSRKIKVLQAEVTALRDRVGALEIAAPQAGSGTRVRGNATSATDSQPAVAAVTKHKLCPKCLKAPAYYFHVKYCEGPEKQKDDDRLGTTVTP